VSALEKRQALAEFEKGQHKLRAGDTSLARSHFQRAVKLDPDNTSALHALGAVHLQAGNIPLAIKTLRGCVERKPDSADAHFDLARALAAAGKQPEAIERYRSALALRPRFVDAAVNLASILEASGNIAQAETLLRLTVQWRPSHVESSMKLANLLRLSGREGEALSIIESARALAPNDAAVVDTHARVLGAMGRFSDAVAIARIAVTMQSDVSSYWTTLGSAQRQLRQIEAGIASFRHALDLDADNTYAALELALALDESGDTDNARKIWSTVKAPAHLQERLRWMTALSLPAIYADDAEIGRSRDHFASGIVDLSRHLERDRVDAALLAESAASVTPFFLHYQPRNNTTLQCQLADLVAAAMRRAAPALSAPCEWALRSGERVRVGFVSAHLMQHTVSRYFGGLITGLDRSRFDVSVWYLGGVIDDSTRDIARSVDTFVETRSDVRALGRLIRDARLDVLIYPEIGMDARHQALAALRLAPIQCAMYGHPATSGAANVDYFLSGDAMEPDGAQQHYRERLIRLPGIGTTPAPPARVGDGSWYDERVNRRPLLLCLQNLLKLAPDFDETLALVARETDSRIGFFSRIAPLTGRFRRRIEATFRNNGVNPDEHLDFLPSQPYADYLAGVARCPLILDSAHFSGGSTSLDAISVGAPVVAWDGEMMRGRQTGAMLRMMDVPQLIVSSQRDYVDLCVRLMADGVWRDELGQTLRARQSVIFRTREPLDAFSEFLATAMPVSTLPPTT
jgi:protein O-GlcNAc transferase